MQYPPFYELSAVVCVGRDGDGAEEGQIDPAKLRDKSACLNTYLKQILKEIEYKCTMAAL